jgi:hypothetical protein
MDEAREALSGLAILPTRLALGIIEEMLRLATGLLAAALLLVFVPAAHAHHTDNIFPTVIHWDHCSPESYCRSDNSTLSFYREGSLTNNARNLIWNTLYDKYGYPTVLTLKHENPGIYTGSAETDLVFRINPGIYPSPARTECNDPISPILCDQFFVYFGNDYWSQRPNVVCHEIGHGIGFVHGQHASPQKQNNDNSLECMSNADSAPYVVGQHMLPQINSTY